MFFGMLLGAASAHFIFHPQLSGLLSFAAVSGAAALLPDLDMRKSKASKITYAGLAAVIIAAAFWLSYSGGFSLGSFALYAAVLFASALLLDSLLRPRHRGIMHSLAFLAVFAAASFLFFGGFFASAAAVGYFSHLLADFCIKPA